MWNLSKPFLYDRNSKSPGFLFPFTNSTGISTSYRNLVCVKIILLSPLYLPRMAFSSSSSMSFMWFTLRFTLSKSSSMPYLGSGISEFVPATFFQTTNYSNYSISSFSDPGNSPGCSCKSFGVTKLYNLSDLNSFFTFLNGAM